LDQSVTDQGYVLELTVFKNADSTGCVVQNKVALLKYFEAAAPLLLLNGNGNHLIHVDNVNFVVGSCKISYPEVIDVVDYVLAWSVHLLEIDLNRFGFEINVINV
jgi:hypothetical protein